MLSIDDVIKISKKLEAILADRFNAHGKGLHEKINDVESELTPLEVRGLRAVATIRNKAVHDDNFSSEDVPADFEPLYQELLRTLGSNAERESEEYEPKTNYEYQEMYCSYLRDEGLEPLVDNGDVEFKHGGKYYFIIVDAADSEYFRILYPNFWEIESKDELERAYKAANKATANTKVAKVYVLSAEDAVSASVGLFLYNPSSFRYVFWRSMRALCRSVDKFSEAMHEDEDYDDYNDDDGPRW